MIAFKQKRANNPQGVSHDWSESLFLEIDGKYFGHQTGGINGTDLMSQPVNTKYWDVMKDTKFIMSPADNSDLLNPSRTSGYYGGTRRLRYSVPWYKKVSFEGDEDNIPDNIDFKMCVVVYGRPLGKDVVADV